MKYLGGPMGKVERGFSLIEVMVAIGVMGIVGYAFTALIKNGTIGQKTVLAQDDARVLTDNMGSVLADSESCAATFAGLDPTVVRGPSPSDRGPTVRQIKDKTGKVFFELTTPPTKYGNRGIQLDGVSLGGSGTVAGKTGVQRWVATSDKTGVAAVEVDWEQTGGSVAPGGSTQSLGNYVGPGHLPRYFFIQVMNWSPTTGIIACVGLGGASRIGTGTAGLVPLWTAENTLTDSVMSQDPSSAYIGVGMAPGAFASQKLEVNGNIKAGDAILAGAVTIGGSVTVTGTMKPGSFSVNSSCNPEGAFGYDSGAHAPVFCNSSGAWQLVGASPDVPQGTWCGTSSGEKCKGHVPPDCPDGYHSALYIFGSGFAGGTCFKN